MMFERNGKRNGGTCQKSGGNSTLMLRLLVSFSLLPAGLAPRWVAARWLACWLAAWLLTGWLASGMLAGCCWLLGWLLHRWAGSLLGCWLLSRWADSLLGCTLPGWFQTDRAGFPKQKRHRLVWIWDNYNNYSPRIIAWKTSKTCKKHRKNNEKLRKTWKKPKKNYYYYVILANYNYPSWICFILEPSHC